MSVQINTAAEGQTRKDRGRSEYEHAFRHIPVAYSRGYSTHEAALVEFKAYIYARESL